MSGTHTHIAAAKRARVPVEAAHVDTPLSRDVISAAACRFASTRLPVANRARDREAENVIARAHRELAAAGRVAEARASIAVVRLQSLIAGGIDRRAADVVDVVCGRDAEIARGCPEESTRCDLEVAGRTSRQRERIGAGQIAASRKFQ